jgi:HPt (histidine-containing phosphotransfer) domain-containing protein
VACSHSDQLQRAAHALKGSVGNFCAQKAFDAALRLEKMGKSENLSEAEEAWSALEAEIERLQPALETLSQGRAPAAC